MKLLGWVVERGENRRVFGHAGTFVTLRLDVPTIYVYRQPLYGVLWGARSCDVQLGAAADLARQDVLNERARQRRQKVQLLLSFQDKVTPVFLGIAGQFAALVEPTQRATEAMESLAIAYNSMDRETRT